MTESERSRNLNRIVPKAQPELDCAETRVQAELDRMQQATEEGTLAASDTEASEPPPSPLSDSADFIAEFALFPGVEICEPLQPIEHTTIAVEHPDTVLSAVEEADAPRGPSEAANDRSHSEDPATLGFLNPVDKHVESELNSELPTTSFDETVVDELTEQPAESPQEQNEPTAADLPNVSEPAASSSQDDWSNTADDEDEDWTAEQPDENLLFVSTRCKNCRAYYRFRIAEKLQFACRECGELCVVKPSVAGRLKQWFGGRLKPKKRG